MAAQSVLADAQSVLDEVAASQESHEIPEASGPLPQGEPCPSCGAIVDTDDRFCPYCGAQHAQVAREVPTQKRYFQCGGCGAQMGADPDQRSYQCPFCDAAQVIEFSPDVTGRQEPEFVIGFGMPPAEAAETYNRWVNAGGMFRPGNLKSSKLGEKLRGVYVPFWSFSMLADSAWSARIGEYWYRTETYTTTDAQGKTVTRTRTVRETEWWPLQGRHHHFYSHYLVSGSKGLDQHSADRIKPFHLAALHRYTPSFLAGWLSEEYSIGVDQALATSQQEFYRLEQEQISQFLPGDTFGGLQVQTQFSRATSDLILLPMYISTYHHRGKQYRFMINGQTGKISGDKPLSAARIVIAIALGIAVLGVAAYFAFAAGGQ